MLLIKKNTDFSKIWNIKFNCFLQNETFKTKKASKKKHVYIQEYTQKMGLQGTSSERWMNEYGWLNEWSILQTKYFNKSIPTKYKEIKGIFSQI